MQKGFVSNGLLVLSAIMIVVIFLFKQGYFQVGSNLNSIYISPSPLSFQPTLSSIPYDRGFNYQSGQEVSDYSFSFKYPEGWKVFIKDDSQIYGFKNGVVRLGIELIPVEVVKEQGENLLWGGFFVDVYPQTYSNIENWFDDYISVPLGGMEKFPNKREYYMYSTRKFGNETVYEIEAADKYPHREGYGGVSVILGKTTTYRISNFQDGMNGFWERLEKDIFPSFRLLK